MRTSRREVRGGQQIGHDVSSYSTDVGDGRGGERDREDRVRKRERGGERRRDREREMRNTDRHSKTRERDLFIYTHKRT